MDLDSPRYRSVRQKMIQLMKPVITFLNNMKKEREKGSQPDERPLEMKATLASPTYLQNVNIKENTSQKFIYPETLAKHKKGPNEAKISYLRPIDQIDQIKTALDVRSNKEVGEKTFDYFFEMEIND